MIQEIKYITRENILEKVEPFIGDSLIKVIVGQRRVGKSYILYQLIDIIKKLKKKVNIIYINKEDFQFDSVRNYSDLINYVESKYKNQHSNHLFIDEIQDIEQFEKALRHFQNTSKYDIYCTGSNAKLLSGELATYLSGRYIQIRVYSLSYKEFLSFHKLTDSEDNLYKYIQFGGMPHLINLKNRPEVYREYLNNIINTIVLHDIVARYNIRNINFLQNLLKFIADSVGSIVSAKRISDYLKSQKLSVQPRTVIDYLNFVENVFFIERVNRTEIQGRKIFEIGDKFYFEDIGLRHSLIPYKQNDINKVLENLVFHQLKILGYTVFVGKKGDKEIDFVADKDGKTTYIQVTYLIIDEATRKREFGNLLSIKDNYRKIVVSMDKIIADSSYQGIEHWEIRDFLLNFE